MNMTRLTDGKRTAEITVTTWNGEQYAPDFSNDFFSVGDLKYDEEKEAYIVSDVEYCAEQAFDWAFGYGDFSDAETEEIEKRIFQVDYIGEDVNGND